MADEDLAARVVRLERRMRWLGGVCAICIAIAIGIGAGGFYIASRRAPMPSSLSFRSDDGTAETLIDADGVRIKKRDRRTTLESDELSIVDGNDRARYRARSWTLRKPDASEISAQITGQPGATSAGLMAEAAGHRVVLRAAVGNESIGVEDNDGSASLTKLAGQSPIVFLSNHLASKRYEVEP